MGLRRTMSNFKKNNKKSANKKRKNYKIESLEPRLMMDASVNDWNDELNALNVGAYTIDSNSSKIDGLLVVIPQNPIMNQNAFLWQM